MQKNLNALLSLVAASVAILSCVGVGYFAWSITEARTAYADKVSSAQLDAQRYAISTRTRAIINETVSEREALAKYLNVDVLSMVGLIQDAGASGGATIEVGNALPEAVGTQSASSASGVGAVGFLVTGHGSFSALMRTLQLLETLPAPASVLRFDIKQVPSVDGASRSWDMNVYIRVLTTTPITA
jgi:hypothetical protein